MKLTEIYNVKPKYAWFEPATNSAGMKGVRLAFLEPTMPRFDAQIADATIKHDNARLDRVKTKRQNYKDQNQTTFPRSPDLGWWLNTEDFHSGENNQRGLTKGNIYQRYPDLEIFKSRKEAEAAAKKAGII
jgi:hypothetical protein